MSSKTTEAKPKSAKKPQAAVPAKESAERGERMKGCDILIKALEREGVEVIFAYPGGASMEFHQALTRSTIRTVLPRHEQGGVFQAEGYARASGKAGVCMATSGPGATNLVTGIADAYLDSTPLVAITGQVPRHMIGKGAFQETDVFSVTAQIVKHNFLVMDVNDIARIVKEAFHIAQTGRPGPVLIDIPKDVQVATAPFKRPDVSSHASYRPQAKADAADIATAVGMIAKAKRPIFYTGGGVINAGPDASASLRELVELTGCVPQCACPLGHAEDIALVFDEAILRHDYLIYSPGPPERTLEVATADLARLLPRLPNRVLNYRSD